MKKALILTNQSGFLWKFELENVLLLQSLGFIIHYASNSAEEGYHYDPCDLDRMGVIYHDIPIARSPYMWRMNFEALRRLMDIVENETAFGYPDRDQPGRFCGCTEDAA